jgi:hypothetical protein
MDVKKKAAEFMQDNTDYPQDEIALVNLEKALIETWNEAIELAAQNVAGHWNDGWMVVNQKEQAQRSAAIVRQLKKPEYVRS